MKVPQPDVILTDDRRIWDAWLSLHKFPALVAADRLGVFTALARAALTTGELADRLGAVPRALDVVLGYLASFGMLERREQRWRATPDACVYMDATGPAHWGPLMSGFAESQPLQQNILDLLTKGYATLPPRSGVEEWERGALEPQAAVGMAAFMNAHSIYSSQAAARQPMFGDVRSLMDVGGGSGIFSIAIARAWPRLAATIMEIEAMCDAAQAYIDSAAIGERVRTQGVDMFRQPWPTGHDAHLFSNIFHDWSEETNRMLAKKSFAALEPGGRIILHEMLVDDDGCGPETTLSFSILMLLGTRGRQYGFSELRGFLEQAGFVDVDATRTGAGYYSLVTGRRPG